MGLLSNKNKSKAKTTSDTTTTTPDYSAKLVLLGDSSVGKTSLAIRFVNGSFHPFQEPTIGASFLSCVVLTPTKNHNIASNSVVNAEQEEEDGEMASSPESSSSSVSLSPPAETVSSLTTAAAAAASTSTSALTKSVLFKIWDTAGQERYQSLTPLYFRGATAAILVYDVSKFHSYHTLSRWVRELKQFGPSNILLTVVGNKSDLAHEMRSVDQYEAQAFAHSIGAVYIETSAKNGINVDLVFQELAQRIVIMESSSSSSTGVNTNNNNVDGAVDLAATADSEYTRSKCC